MGSFTLYPRHSSFICEHGAYKVLAEYSAVLDGCALGQILAGRSVLAGQLSWN